MVMTTTAMLLSTAGLMVLPPLTSQVTMRLAKLSAANALPKKPARVMPTWMVERNWVGAAVMASSLFAPLSPSSTMRWILLSLRESTAISVIAKNALMAISTACRINCPIRGSPDVKKTNSFCLPPARRCGQNDTATYIKNYTKFQEQLHHPRRFPSKKPVIHGKIIFFYSGDLVW